MDTGDELTSRQWVGPRGRQVDGGARYQDKVSVLRAAVLIGQFEDVALLDELVGGAHYVLLATQQLVDLQQLPHPLLPQNNDKEV